MSDTYKYLPKQMKQAVDMFDVETFDHLLKKERYGEIAYLLHTIIKMTEEGKPLSQFHQEVVEHPFRLWGDDAERVLRAMRELMWEEIRAGKYKKKQPVPKEQRIAERYAALEKFETVNC